jgi:hypothetical protein
MKYLKYVLKLTCASLLVCAALLALLELGYGRVEPGWIGVRQGNWGGGIDPIDHGPGLHFGPRGLSTWHLVDGRAQLLRFGPMPSGENERPPLDFRTKDNTTAKAEFVLGWRVHPGAAHELVRAGIERNVGARVAAIAEDVLRRELGALASEDWFSAELLEAKELEIRPRVAAALSPLHVDVLGVWLLDVGLSAEYERKLQERQVAWQRNLLQEAAQRAERARSDASEVAKDTEIAEAQRRADGARAGHETEAELELRLATIQARTERYEKETRAAAELDYQRSVTSASLELDQAEALESRLRLDALGADGGKAWLGRQAAQNLKIKGVTLDSRAPGAPSLIDLDAFVALLLGARVEPGALQAGVMGSGTVSGKAGM